MALSHLRSLQALELALRLGSLRAAGRLLWITPAAVGQRIKALEDYLGIDLVVRGRSGLRPTSELSGALEHLRAAFHELDTAATMLNLQRGDEICTSALAVGELLAGVYRDKSEAEAIRVRDGIVRSGVRILPFDLAASTRFGSIRARYRTSAADSIHLACAVTASVDLFLTGDEGLLKLHVDGIKFIAGINTDLF